MFSLNVSAAYGHFEDIVLYLVLLRKMHKASSPIQSDPRRVDMDGIFPTFEETRKTLSRKSTRIIVQERDRERENQRVIFN